MPELFGQHMWAEAETAAEGYMRELGFADAQVTRGTGDGGVDVTSERAVAQSKYQGKPVGREPVQRIRGVAFDRAALFFSWSGYTAGAVEFATAAGVALFNVPNGEPVACSPAAQELLDEVSEASQLRREAAAAAAAAQAAAARAAERENLESEQRIREANARAEVAQAEATRAAERDTLESEQRIREAKARAEAARAEKEAAKARQRAVAAEQRAVRSQQKTDKRAARRAALEQRREEQRVANAPKVAARAERRAYLASLPGYTRDTRLAVAFGIAGVGCPVGFGLIAGWFALRARTTLTRHGVERSPNLLRFAAVLATVGISLAAMVVVGSPNGFSEEPSDLVSGLAALAGGLAAVGALAAWYTLPKKRTDRERETAELSS